MGLSLFCDETTATTVDAESCSHSCSHIVGRIDVAFVMLKKKFDPLCSDSSSASAAAANTWGSASFAIDFDCLSQGSSSDSNSDYYRASSSCASPAQAFLERRKASLRKAEVPP